MAGPNSLQPSLRAVDPKDEEAQRRRIQDAARQLEGVFMGMMFEEMSKGVAGEDGLFPKSPGSDMYQQWFRSEVASQFAQTGGLGLGDTIAQQLLGGKGAALPHAPNIMPEGLKPGGMPSAVPSDVPVAPVEGRVTSDFGSRVHPVTGHVHEHRGVDIAVPVGTPVHVPYGGRVLTVGENKYLGKYVIVRHRGGMRSLYAHLSEVSVEEGQDVNVRGVVGRSGNTGRSTGPHLHFGMYIDGKPVDPAQWVDLGRRSGSDSAR